MGASALISSMIEVGGSGKLPRITSGGAVRRGRGAAPETAGEAAAAGSSASTSSGSSSASGSGVFEKGRGFCAARAPSAASAPAAFTLRTRGTLSPRASAASSTPSFSLLCFLRTSRRIFSLRRTSRKWAQAVRRACARAATKRAMPVRKAANENCVARMSDTNSDVARTM